MGWLATLFSFDSSQRSRKDAALSSTHDAFSLPTSSPGYNSPQAFNPDSLRSPDIEAPMHSTYTYPPKSSSSYGYVPTSDRSGLHSRPTSTSLLPLHMDPLHSPFSSNSMYPPLSKTWNRLRLWLSREYPELGDTLNYGILPQDLTEIENRFGFALPSAVRESYLCVDGQEAESAAGCSEGLFFGLTLLPLEDVYEEWRFWRGVDDDPNTGANPQLREVMQSIPAGWIRKEYSQRGWIPLIADRAGNYIGVDLNPAKDGSVGQVIVFGRDFDTKVVMWKGDGPAGWARWLANFVEELESGEGFEIGGAEASEGSEDDLGYESYFYDGSGRGQGDGGGDAGSGGGLRMTGEYRGWNVLEAWADRSLRKWHESGAVTDAPLSSAEEGFGKTSDTVGLGVDVVELAQGTGVEVPIPVLADPDEPIPPPTVLALNPPAEVPSISVTKAPAPRPVELPTAQEIANISLPSSPILSSFDEDLESGRTRGMREVGGDLGFTTIPKSNPHNSIDNESAHPAQPPLPVPSEKIPDLLAETTPAIGTVPIEPSSPLGSSNDTTLMEKSLESTSDNIHQQEDSNDSVELSSNTIRLVGNGGTTGTVGAQISNPGVGGDEAVDSDTQSIASVTSETSVKKAGKSHKKTKSALAGLKKLGLSGLRKTDSMSLAADVQTPSKS